MALAGCCVPYSPKRLAICDKEDVKLVESDLTYYNDKAIDKEIQSIIDTNNIKEENNESMKGQEYVVNTTESNMARTVSSISFEDGSFYKSNSFSQDSNFDFLSESNGDSVILSSNDEEYDDLDYVDSRSRMSFSTQSSSTFDYFADENYFAVMRDITNLMHDGCNREEKEGRDPSVGQSTPTSNSMREDDQNMKPKDVNKSSSQSQRGNIVTKGYQSQEVDAVRNSNFNLLHTALVKKSNKNVKDRKRKNALKSIWGNLLRKHNKRK